ncbi:MAG: hypothetical protein AAF423_10850 [Pseudomonadota bacterium]
MFPDLRRFVEINVTNRGAWYYMGVYKPSEKRWGYYDTEENEPRRRIKNFYSANWKFRDGKLTLEHIRSAEGSILVPISDIPVMGRSAEKPWSGDNWKSNNPIVAIANKSDCLYVHNIETVATKSRNNPSLLLWMWATKITCD